MLTPRGLAISVLLIGFGALGVVIALRGLSDRFAPKRPQLALTINGNNALALANGAADLLTAFTTDTGPKTASQEMQDDPSSAEETKPAPTAEDGPAPTAQDGTGSGSGDTSPAATAQADAPAPQPAVTNGMSATMSANADIAAAQSLFNRTPEPTDTAAPAAPALPGSTPEDRATARDMSIAALLQTPLQPKALRNLAIIADADGQADRARHLMTLTESRTRRDVVVQGWLLGQALQREDYAAAMRHLDLMFRPRNEIPQAALPALAALVLNPKLTGDLGALLATDPKWRGWFLDRLTRLEIAPDSPLGPDADTQLSDAIGNLFAAIIDHGGTLTPEEIARFIDRLIQRRAYDNAYAQWVRFYVPPDELGTLGYLYNGDFSKPINDIPFNWRELRKQSSVDLAIVDEPERPGTKALRLQFIGGDRVPFRDFMEQLALPPGDYTLVGKVKAEALKNPRGMVWRVYCNQQTGWRILGESPLFRGDIPWSSFSADITVPEDCPGQYIRLELAYRVPVEEVVSGSISFADLRINRKETPTN
ncbi:hypothetical protein [Ancylobacter lacus]|uniref:hypothetical protein n=1 Tax=Ancylobacter lacus TaxID=2579970 RepID=UPI001BCF70D6|nr:hypothetical protein [Ancylobacter lacus]MBS7538486.1 hypothetical protein [Ancylobacter lacus]